MSYIKSVLLRRHICLMKLWLVFVSRRSKYITLVLKFDKEFTCGVRIVDYFDIDLWDYFLHPNLLGFYIYTGLFMPSLFYLGVSELHRRSNIQYLPSAFFREGFDFLCTEIYIDRCNDSYVSFAQFMVIWLLACSCFHLKKLLGYTHASFIIHITHIKQ